MFLTLNLTIDKLITILNLTIQYIFIINSTQICCFKFVLHETVIGTIHDTYECELNLGYLLVFELNKKIYTTHTIQN